MLPARADWPPNNFTPRRLLSLSRPLRELPPAFLCAIVNYFALGVFLAAPLAGAAFFVDAALAGFSAAALAGADFLALGALSGSALATSAGAGLGVSCSSTAGAAADSLGLGVLAGLGAGSAFSAAGFFSALWSPIAVIRRIVCCWRWPFLRR